MHRCGVLACCQAAGHPSTNCVPFRRRSLSPLIPPSPPPHTHTHSHTPNTQPLSLSHTPTQPAQPPLPPQVFDECDIVAGLAAPAVLGVEALLQHVDPSCAARPYGYRRAPARLGRRPSGGWDLGAPPVRIMPKTAAACCCLSSC